MRKRYLSYTPGNVVRGNNAKEILMVAAGHELRLDNYFNNKVGAPILLSFDSFTARYKKPEDHWSCIAHLSAEDMLKSAVIEEKKFKHSPRVGADNPLRPEFEFNRKASSLWSFVASLKRTSTSDFIHIFS